MNGLVGHLIEDHYSAWLSDCCVTHGVSIEGVTWARSDSRSALRQSYEAWCALRQIPQASRQGWGRWMHRRFKLDSVEGVRIYYGIALKPVPQTVIPESVQK